MNVNLEEFLKIHFNYSQFKIGQKEVITSIMNGNHTVAVLPTGTGKSLCYQLPSYLLPGTTIIVSPLLSLMQDQVEQMKMRGEKSVIALNSFLSWGERRVILNRLEDYKFIFCSPEMLLQDGLLRHLKNLNISLFVIDEAHCISQWGYDFRPDYMKLGMVREQLGNPLTLALTATATKKVVSDIVQSLQLKKWKEYVFSVDRPNIAINIEKLESANKKDEKLLRLISDLEGPGIVYFSSRKKAESTVFFLKEHGIHNVSAYHGGMDQESRVLIQQQFIHGQLNLVCATSAFGMGINHESVRFIIHYHLPLQIESYLQEIGRAGRDGKESIAILLYSQGDEQLSYHLVENELPDDSQVEQVIYLRRQESHLSILEQEEEMRARAGLNEVQWRLTSDFFANMEKNGNNLDDSIQQFQQYIRYRLLFKTEKIQQVKDWIDSLQCRREKILNYFDEQKKMEVANCCDICGLDITPYQKKKSEKFTEKNYDWKDYLAAILLKRERT